MSRFWLIPLIIAVFVIVPFLVWGEALTTMAWPGVEGAARGMWLIGILLLIADIAIPVPGVVIIAGLGFVYGPFAGAAFAIIGSLASAALGWVAGRYLGRPAAVRLIGNDLASGERAFARYGGWIVALSRWLPVLPEVVAVSAGTARMGLAPFLAASACGAVPFCIVFATVGHFGTEAPGWAIAVTALTPVALWPLARRLIRDAQRA